MKELLKICVFALTGVPALGLALGLGKIEVQSKLNEPLSAEISLIYSDSSEATEAVVSLASDEDFARVDLDSSNLPVELQFEVVRNNQGNYVVQVKSLGVVSEPFLDFLIEVSWPNGRLLREYVVLLDPPVTAPSRGAAQVTPLSDGSQSDTSTPSSQSDTDTSASSSGSVSNGSSSGLSSRGSSTTYGPVTSGDTLWEIARDWRPSEDVSINQMMVMLLQMNPDAFFQDNVNALKSGAILRLPDQSDFAALDNSSANLAVRDQNETWNSFAGTRSTTPTVSDAGLSSEYTDSGTTSRPPRNDSRLEIVPPEGTADSQFDRPGSSAIAAAENEAAGLRSDLSRVREELIATNQENSELNSRVGELELLVESLEQALTLKDDELANLQVQQALIDDAPASSYDTPTDTSSDTVDTSFGTTTDTSIEDTTTETLPDPFASDTTTSVADSDPINTNDTTVDDATTATVEEPANNSTSVVSTPRRPKPSLMEKLIPWGGGALGLLALIGGGIWFMRRRGDDDGGGRAEFQLPEIPVKDEAVEDDVLTEMTGVALPAVDIATLQGEVKENPSDPQAHLALLRTYYASEDKDSFIVAAEEMQANIDQTHPAWMEVRNMGTSLAPGLALFGTGSEAVADAVSDNLDDLDVGFELEGSDVETDALSSDDRVTAETDLDLDLGDLDFEEDPDKTEEIRSVSSDDDLGLENLDVGIDLPEADDDDGSLDFDLNLDDIEDGSDETTTIVRSVIDTNLEPVADTDSTDEDDLDLGLDFDLDDADLALDPIEETSDDAGATEAVSLELGSDGSSDDDEGFDLELDDLDLDLEDDDLGDVAELVADARSGPETSDSTISDEDDSSDDDIFSELGLDDLDLDDGDISGGDDDVGTKLDLAKAYLDMGDPDGAKGMLEEVIKQGSDSQQEEAKQLLDNL